MDNFETVRNLLMHDRSVRKFDNNRKISRQQLEKLVELTRYCASGRNLQPLKYRLVYSEEECTEVFPALKWASYLTDWDGPDENQRPVAYLIQCLDTDLTENPLCDDGLQLQAMTLGATAMGIAGCIIKSFNLQTITNVLHLKTNLRPLYILALGYPKETVEIDTSSEEVEYYRTPDGVHHVPKRPLADLLAD